MHPGLEKYLPELVRLRKELHQYPEVAHEEKETAERILNFLKSHAPDRTLTNIGGYGLAAVYEGKEPGPAVMIRAELDALPIQEYNNFDHASKNHGLGHLCGHDGHMVMVGGLAPLLAEERPARGKVILLYQPAEETGEGALQMLRDSQFRKIEPDYVFALHNLPGYPKNRIIIREGVFASASKGLIFRLKGAPSHAGHPKDGRNPSMAAAQIVESLMSIAPMHTDLHRAALITPIHIRVGRPAFGTSPGEGEVMFTLRSHSNEVMETITEEAIRQAGKIAEAHEIRLEHEWTEKFVSLVNDPHAVSLVQKAASGLGTEVHFMAEPFPWSEDFGHFTEKYKGALFGLGAGEQQPQLHNENYDFPEELLETGLTMFHSIIREILKEK